MKTFVLDLVNPFNVPLKVYGWPLWWGGEKLAEIDAVYVGEKNQVEFSTTMEKVTDEAYVTVCRKGDLHLVLCGGLVLGATPTVKPKKVEIDAPLKSKIVTLPYLNNHGMLVTVMRGDDVKLPDGTTIGKVVAVNTHGYNIEAEITVDTFYKILNFDIGPTGIVEAILEVPDAKKPESKRVRLPVKGKIKNLKNIKPTDCIFDETDRLIGEVYWIDLKDNHIEANIYTYVPHDFKSINISTTSTLRAQLSETPPYTP